MFAAFANQPAIQPSNHPAAHQSGNKICFHIASARMGHRGPIEMLITGRSIWHRAVVKQIRHGITKDPVPFVQPARFVAALMRKFPLAEQKRAGHLGRVGNLRYLCGFNLAMGNIIKNCDSHKFCFGFLLRDERWR